MADAPLQETYVVDTAGRVLTIPADQAQAALDLGYAPASPEQADAFRREVEFQRRYGSGGQAAIAGLESAGRALTLGLTTGLQLSMGADAEAIAARERANPAAAGVGEAAGILVPLVASGGFGGVLTGAAKGVGGGALRAASAGALRTGAAHTAPVLAARAGMAVTRAAGAAMPAAETVAGQIATRAVALGLGSAVEGAAYGLGQVIHEATLGDPNLTAQSALAEIGLSAAIGGAAGKAIGVAEVGLPAAGRQAKKAIAGAFKKTEGGLKKFYAQAESLTGVAGDVAGELLDQKQVVSRLGRRVPGVADDLSQAPLDVVRSTLEHADDVAKLDAAAPGVVRHVLGAPAPVARPIVENAAQAAQLEQAARGIVRDLANASPTTVEAIIKATPAALQLEKASPGLLRRLVRTEPAAAEALLSNPAGAVRLEAASHGVLRHVAAAPPEQAKLLLAGAEQVALIEAAAPGTALRLLDAPPDVVRRLLDNAPAVAELEGVSRGLARDMLVAPPEMTNFVLQNASRFAALERAFPGTTRQLARTSPETAEFLLENWPKIFTDPAVRVEVAQTLTKGMTEVIEATEGVLKRVNQELAPVEAQTLLASADRELASEAYETTIRSVRDAIEKMRAEPELYDQAYARHLEAVFDGLLRDRAGITEEALETIAEGAAQTTARAIADAAEEAAGPTTATVRANRETRVVTPQAPRGERARYTVIEADELIPSHNAQSFTPNPKYPAGVQEREYLRQPEEQRKVVLASQNLNPSLLLTDTPSALDGPPLVTKGAPLVLGGNGRTMILQRAYAGEGGASYRQALLDRAPLFGIAREEVEKLQKPVLVRVVEELGSDAPKSTLTAAVRRYNEGLTQQLSPRALAVAEAKNLSPRTTQALGELLSTDAEASLRDLMRTRPREFVDILERDGLITPQNRAQWVAGANLTEQAKDRIEGLFLGRVIGTGDRLASTAPGLVQKLERATPHLLRVDGINPGYGEIAVVRRAIDLLNDAARTGQRLDDLVRQGNLLGPAADPAAVQMARVFERSTPKEIAARFGAWSKAAAFDPNQGTLFGGRPTRAQALENLFKDLPDRAEAAAAVAASAVEVAETVAETARVVSPVAAFRRLQTLRQSLDEAIPYTREATGLSERGALRLVKQLRRQVKGVLVDERVFGPAAARRSAIDDAQSEWLTLFKRGGDFNRKFMTKHVVKGGVKYEVKPTKLNTWLNQMADARGEDFSATWGRAMAAARRIAEEAEASAVAAGVADFDRQAIESLILRAEEATREARVRASVTQFKNQLDPRMSWGSNAVAPQQSVLLRDGLPMPAPVPTRVFADAADEAGLVARATEVASSVAPRIVAAPVGAAVGLVRGATSVPRTVAALAALERLGQATNRKVSSWASTLVRAGVKAAHVGRREVSAGVGRDFGRTAKDAAAQYAKRAEEVRDLAGNPEALHERLTTQGDGIQDAAPDTTLAMHLASVRAVMFLASKLPQEPRRGPLGAPVEPSPAEVARWTRYYEAIEDPVGILKQAAAGTLTPEAVEAVRVVYPELFAQIALAVYDQLAKHPNVPYRSRLMLSLLLGEDMDGSIGMGAANQSAFAAPQRQSGPGPSKAGSVTLSSRTLTPQQRAAARG